MINNCIWMNWRKLFVITKTTSLQNTRSFQTYARSQQKSLRQFCITFFWSYPNYSLVPILKLYEKIQKIKKSYSTPKVPKLGTHTSNMFSMFESNEKMNPVGIVTCYSLCLNSEFWIKLEVLFGFLVCACFSEPVSTLQY